MLRRKDFICSRCSFKFFKNTPSTVEKCPQCSNVCYDTRYKLGDPLDPYSRSKLRWYSEESGEKHRDEIRHRKIKVINGKKVAVVVDDKGRVIEEMPDFNVKQTNIGSKSSKGRL